MRAAPPADHPVARLGLWAGASAALASLSVAAPVWWLAWHAGSMRFGGDALVWGGLTLAVLMAAAVALFWWRHAARQAPQRLRWDSTGWQLLAVADGEEIGAPAVRVDLGHAMLLCAQASDGRTVWLPLERRDAPASWHRLRVALGQAAPAQATPKAVPGPQGAHA